MTAVQKFLCVVIQANYNGPHKWYRYEIAEVAKTMSISAKGGTKNRETEVIWTNWKIT